MGKYQFNTKNHTRIWFGGNPSVFLNEENQLRMVNFRQKNPSAHMTFLYSSEMLNLKAIEQLKTFCNKQNFTHLDFDTELLAECTDSKDQAMHALAVLELTAYRNQQGGVLAAASDITRLIKPLLRRGTYSDFDTSIEVEKLPESMVIKGPMLFNMGSLQLAPGSIPESMVLSNDIIGVAMQDGDLDPAAETYLRLLQDSISSNYNVSIFDTLERFSKNPIYASALMVKLYNVKMFQLLFECRPKIELTDFRLFIDKSTRNIFARFRVMAPETFTLSTKSLNNELKNKLLLALRDFIHDDFPENFTIEEQNIIKKTTIDHLMLCLKFISEDLLLIDFKAASKIKVMYEGMKAIDDPDEACRWAHSLAGSTRYEYMKESVVFFTGPGQIIATLFQDIRMFLSESYKAMSFDENHLFDAFHSGQSIRLGTTEEEYVAKFNPDGKAACGQSWLEGGQKAMREREKNAHNATRIIQNSWKSFLDEKNKKSPSDHNTDHTLKPSKR